MVSFECMSATSSKQEGCTAPARDHPSTASIASTIVKPVSADLIAIGG